MVSSLVAENLTYVNALIWDRYCLYLRSYSDRFAKQLIIRGTDASSY